jgi:hypothetical protein
MFICCLFHSSIRACFFKYYLELSQSSRRAVSSYYAQNVYLADYKLKFKINVNIITSFKVNVGFRCQIYVSNCKFYLPGMLIQLQVHFPFGFAYYMSWGQSL